MAVVSGVRFVGWADPGGGFQVQGVHECLGEVAAQLVFGGVVFLGVQPWGSAGAAGAFVPGGGVDGPVLLVQGQRDEEPAEGERPFGFAQWSLVVPESVGVAVDGQVAQVAVQGGDGAGVVGGQRPAERR